MEQYGTHNPARVLLVDDSTVIRKTLSKILSSYPEIVLSGEASNGKQAVEVAAKLKPDIILLDIEMPIMDGMEALPELIMVSPESKVIILSTLTRKNATLSFRALELGAADYMEKPQANDSLEEFAKLLKNKIMAIANSIAPEATIQQQTSSASDEVPEEALSSFELAPEKKYTRPRILAIGSSTGGPPALTKLLKAISGQVAGIPIVITQHIPKEFDVLLAETLTKSTGIPCSIPQDGQSIESGHAYLAPGGFHMEITTDSEHKPRIHLSQAETEHFCKPSVNPMFRSLAKVYQHDVLAVMLTGMGSDGIEGAKELYEVGAQILAQDEATSVVWGMPGAVANAGICSHVLSIDALPRKIIDIIKG